MCGSNASGPIEFSRCVRRGVISHAISIRVSAIFLGHAIRFHAKWPRVIFINFYLYINVYIFFFSKTWFEARTFRADTAAPRSAGNNVAQVGVREVNHGFCISLRARTHSALPLINCVFPSLRAFALTNPSPGARFYFLHSILLSGHGRHFLTIILLNFVLHLVANNVTVFTTRVHFNNCAH